MGMFSYHVLSTFIFAPLALLTYSLLQLWTSIFMVYHNCNPSLYQHSLLLLYPPERAVATLHQLPLSTFPVVPWCVPAKCLFRLFCLGRLQFLGRLSSLGVQRCYRAVQAELTDLSYDHQFVYLILAAKSLWDTKPVDCFSKLGVTTNFKAQCLLFKTLCLYCIKSSLTWDTTLVTVLQKFYINLTETETEIRKLKKSKYYLFIHRF